MVILFLRHVRNKCPELKSRAFYFLLLFFIIQYSKFLEKCQCALQCESVVDKADQGTRYLHRLGQANMRKDMMGGR